MSFYPQYSNWGKDIFLDSAGAVYDNSGEYEIISGSIGLKPTIFSGQTFSFNNYWDPVSSWTIENSLDSLSVLSGSQSLYLINTTGYQSTASGSYGNSGDVYQTAFFTKVNTPIFTGSEYISGESCSIVWSADNPVNNTLFSNFTAEISLRSLTDGVTHQLVNGLSSGLSCQGIYVATSNTEAFIECHPSGLKVHGPSGVVIPGDFSSRMRRIRVVRNGSKLTIMTDDGQSYSSNDLFIKIPSKVSRYLSFGAPPVVGNTTFPGSGSTLHEFTGWFDPAGLTGIGGFEGTILWDDLKIKTGEGVSIYSDGYSVTWPTGTKTLYTAPWYPNPNVNSYDTAFIGCTPNNGGEITITPQYLVRTGNFSSYSWEDNSSSILIDQYTKTYTSLDISSIPILQGTTNAIRFKLSADCFGYAQVPLINDITIATKSLDSIVSVEPNWKLSSLPKNIFFSVDQSKYSKLIPPAHYQDEIYIHNESKESSIATGLYLEAPQINLDSGAVLSAYSSSGLYGIEDGYYGNAWSNIGNQSGYTGQLFAQSYSNISTGIFKGNLLDSFSVYPSVSSLPTGATGAASVGYNIDLYNDLNNQIQYVQTTTVQGWVSSTTNQELGFAVTGLTFPTGSNYVGVINGIIQIPYGPGVKVTVANNTTSGTYYLDGHLYREPRPFSCSMLYSGSGISSVSFGVLPRSVEPTYLESKWGEWANEMNRHNVDQFKLFTLSGYVGTHSYLQYLSTGDPYRISTLNSGISTGIDYYSPLHREAVIFEGWIRPHGIINTSSEVELFKDLSSDGRGLKVYINRSGEVRATVDLNIHESSLGLTGDSFRKVGMKANGLIATGQTTSAALISNGYSVAWGDWNHIGVYQDTKIIGDTYTAANQPVIATNSGIYNGARSSRLYLEINGNICNNTDVTLDGYTNNFIGSGTIGANFPSTDVYPNTWPKIPTYALTGSTRTGIFGQNIMCDFDHVRFGIRDHVDAKTWSNVYGYKDMPPSFSPYDAIKVASPVSGEYEHFQYAHIYNFDSLSSYLGWDNGFAPNHIIAPNYSSLAADIYSRGIKPGQFFLRKVTGPKNRSALRIGPGQNIMIPFCSFDERIYNGPNTCSMVQGTSVINNASLPYYTIPPSTWTHSNMPYAQSGIVDFSETNADTKLLLGGFIKLHSYPVSGYGDLFSFQEVGYLSTNFTFAPATTTYATAGLYLGINSSGNIVYGSCRTGGSDGYSNAFVVGQFTGAYIPLDTWVHIGLDCDMQLGTGHMDTYVSGELSTSTTLYISTGGGLHPQSGRSLGYQGILGGSVNSAANKPAYYIGGEHARDGGNTYQWMDFSVSEFFIGYPLSGYTWPWSVFASTGEYITGWCDTSVKNFNSKISPTIGTGQGYNAFLVGKSLYPATSFSGAGEHLISTTSNNGNDFEGLNLAGMSLFDDGLFNNAESYYSVYQTNTIEDTFGSTSSPIQIGNRVPNNGINLALITNKEWNTEGAISSFDLSDQNYNNIVNAYQGDIALSGMISYSFGNGMMSTGLLSSPDIRLSSYSIAKEDASVPYVAYFMHLIGGTSNAVYLPGSPSHASLTGDYDLYHSTVSKVKNSIQIKDSNGNILSYDDFPYDVYIVPFGPNVDTSLLSGNYYGFGSGLNTSLFNSDKAYTCILLAHYQTIGKSVFIHYPSIGYDGSNINLQNSEVYNPIPLLKHVELDNAFDANTVYVTTYSGAFSTEINSSLKRYDLKVYGADFTGWV